MLGFLPRLAYYSFAAADRSCKFALPPAKNKTMRASARKQHLFNLFERAAERGWRGRMREVLDAIGHVRAVDRQGRTALMIAAAYGRVEVVQLLLDAGADVDATDQQGMTPLMHAAEARKYGSPGLLPLAVARLLLDAGADPTRRCKRGWTVDGIALFWEEHMMAVSPERVALARMLKAACKSFRARRRRRQRHKPSSRRG